MNKAENNGKHIRRVIETTTCGRHRAGEGQACFVLPSVNHEVYHAGICGKRILKAGYNGKISPQSMRTKAPMKNDDRPPFKRKPNVRSNNLSRN